MVPLEAIVPAAQNNINTQFILLEKGKTTWDGQNRMCLALVADKTAAVHLQLWGEECEAFEAGDIIRMENGIFSYNKNNLVLRAGKRGRVEKVGEFTMEFVETPNLSEIKWVPDPNNSNRYARHTVISSHSLILIPNNVVGIIVSIHGNSINVHWPWARLGVENPLARLLASEHTPQVRECRNQDSETRPKGSSESLKKVVLRLKYEFT
ncbi:hypothetical protein GQ457_02G003010 [Hibiscus cannabinus]